MIEPLFYSWLALALFFAALWRVQARERNASHVDVGWALGLGFMALVAAAVSDGNPARRALVAAMGVAWSLRLSSHLYFDRVRGKPEDGRYARLRRSWGGNAERNFFVFFQAQALLDVILAAPFFAAAARRDGLGACDAAAAALWLASIGGETLADRRLAAFRADPANEGKVCRSGLWGWSRHPNYFFEWMIWVSFAALAPGDWRAWISPALMLYFLLRVTGIPATEAQAVQSRGRDYRRYQEEVSMLIPWPPRRSA